MKSFDMVALKPGFDSQLPVSFPYVVVSDGEAPAFHFIWCHDFLGPAYLRCEGLGVGGQRNEDKAEPGFCVKFRQFAVASVRVFRLLHVQGRAQGAVDFVDPAMIGAHEALGVPLTFDYAHVAMATDSRKRAKLSILSTNDHQGFVGQGQREVVSRLFHLFCPSHTNPVFAKDVLQFPLVKLFRDVHVHWQGAGGFDGG